MSACTSCMSKEDVRDHACGMAVWSCERVFWMLEYVM